MSLPADVRNSCRPASLIQLFCPACGQATAQRYLYSKNGCDILQCSECGLGRAHARGFDPEAYYTAEYFSGGKPDGYANYLSTESVLRLEFACTVDFIRKHCSSGRLLELGCAYGFFLLEARRFFDVTGIEISEAAAAYCRERDLRVFNGVVDERNFSKIGMMDVIVLLDVVEHLPNPCETLALCARHLTPGGRILITTGDFASRYARLSGKRWRLMTPPQHLWYFTRESIRQMSHPLGLSIESYDHPWKMVPISLISFQFRRMLGISPSRHKPGVAWGLPVNLFDAMRIMLRKSA